MSQLHYTRVNFSEGLRYIDNQAFYECSTLSDITLPKTLEELGDSVFEATTLHELVIPDNVRKIGGYICDNIDNKVDIYVSENTAMEPFAFMGNNIVVHAPRNSRAYRMATDCGATTVITDIMVIGEVYDEIVPTDIITTINGTRVNSYAIYGETIILLRDLENAGFDVRFDESTKTAYADFNSKKQLISEENIVLSNNKLLYTDIKVKVNGIEVKGYNTNGYMAIVAEDLGRYIPGMSYEWVNEERTLKLYIE